LAPGAEVSELIGRLEALSGGALPPAGGGGPGARTAGARPAAPAPSAVPASSPAPAPAEASSEGREVAAFGTPGCAAGPAAPAPSPDPAGPPDDVWRGAVAEIEKVSPLAAPALKQATLLGVREGVVEIQLPQGIYATTAERRRGEVEAAFARFFGRPTRLEIVVGPAAGEGAGQPAPSLAAAEAAERTARAARLRESARAHPNIREAARILEGGIDGIEDL
ncbi:MAG TPA: DNA polymerase III subunit gamma/tau, partial [Anaeromyxobacteraceae bacterium]|nr:DNA polymerase III subunit gamma/tau [Anaeromyxobacteraceae bacterium]